MAVTTGSFYWHFSGRQELHDALLKDWYDTNTAPLYEAVKTAGSDPRRQYLAFFGVWVLERDFDPRYDQAIRDWARISKAVANTLREVDASRIQLLLEVFENFGYSGLDAEMRARDLLSSGRILRHAGQGDARAPPRIGAFLCGHSHGLSVDARDEVGGGDPGRNAGKRLFPGRMGGSKTAKV